MVNNIVSKCNSLIFKLAVKNCDIGFKHTTSHNELHFANEEKKHTNEIVF